MKEGIEQCKYYLEKRKEGIKEWHDFEFVRKDDNRIHTSLGTSPILDDEGNYMGAIAGVQDITERKSAEKGLKWELSVNDALAAIYAHLVATSSSIEEISDTVLTQAMTLTGSTQGCVASIDPATGLCSLHACTEILRNNETLSSSSSERISFVMETDFIRDSWDMPLTHYNRFSPTNPNSIQHPKNILKMRCLCDVFLLSRYF